MLFKQKWIDIRPLLGRQFYFISSSNWTNISNHYCTRAYINLYINRRDTADFTVERDVLRRLLKFSYPNKQPQLYVKCEI